MLAPPNILQPPSTHITDLEDTATIAVCLTNVKSRIPSSAVAPTSRFFLSSSENKEKAGDLLPKDSGVDPK